MRALSTLVHVLRGAREERREWLRVGGGAVEHGAAVRDYPEECRLEAGTLEPRGHLLCWPCDFQVGPARRAAFLIGNGSFCVKDL